MVPPMTLFSNPRVPESAILCVAAVHHARGIERGQIDDAVHALLIVEVGRGLALFVAAHAKAEQIVERDGVVQGDALVAESIECATVALQAGAHGEVAVSARIEVLVVIRITAIAVHLAVVRGVEGQLAHAAGPATQIDRDAGRVELGCTHSQGIACIRVFPG
jgi:hypothetical protein